MSGHVTALYHNLYDAGRAIEDLVASGIAPGDISLVTSEARAPIFEIQYDDKARCTAFGAIGGALGAIGAQLTTGGDIGILAARPLLATLATFGSSGHGLTDSLLSVGISEREARFYKHEIRRHEALLVDVASVPHEAVVVRNILERHHATAVAEPA